VFALGTADAQACHAQCTAQGLSISPVAHWSRPVDEANTQGMARFAFFGVANPPINPSFLCWVQHLTPDLLRPPGMTTHANGAVRLTQVDFSGPADAAWAWAQQLVQGGGVQVQQDAGGADIALQSALARIRVDAKALHILPTAMHLEVVDLADLQARCAALNLQTRSTPAGALVIDLQEALGMPWICKPAAH
jgi:Glyoxalase-like domain